MDEASFEEREIRAARNQAMFRAVNEKIKAMNDSFDELVDSFSIACECGDGTCVELLEIPSDAYAAVRRNPRFFAVLPDHVFPEVERVVSTHPDYTVVENTGKAAEIAEATAGRDAESLGTSG